MKLIFSILISIIFCTNSFANQDNKPKIATSDWASVETLAAMGFPPVGAGDKRSYQIWVANPPLPDYVNDTGIRFSPNLELLYQIKPDFFIQSPWFRHLSPQFEKIAPVYEVDFSNNDNGITLDSIINATLKIGDIIKEPQAAKNLIEEAKNQFKNQKQLLKPFNNRPLAVIQFIDARQLRIYGKTSIYHQVLEQLGLENAWTGESNKWGLANITLADLAKLPANSILIIVKPHPRNIYSSLLNSTIWNRLSFSKEDNRRVVSAAWSYGALPSMQHFANLITNSLLLNKNYDKEQW